MKRLKLHERYIFIDQMLLMQRAYKPAWTAMPEARVRDYFFIKEPIMLGAPWVRLGLEGHWKSI